MSSRHVKPGRWRRPRARFNAARPGRGYREPAPDPTRREAPEVEESGHYVALGEHWLWRRLKWIARSLWS